MEKPLLALSPSPARPSSHRWSWFLLSWVRAAIQGALLEVECRSLCLALSKEQWPTVTTRRWLMSLCQVFPRRHSLEARALKESEGQSEGEEGGISGSSLPISPAD